MPEQDGGDQELATRAAFRGGRIAMARLGDPAYLKWKGHRDVVSGASLEVQEAIVSVLRQERPNDAILAEEPEPEHRVALLKILGPLHLRKFLNSIIAHPLTPVVAL